MNKINRAFFFNSIFLKKTFVLLSGTLIAQLIPFLLAPIISRLYSPIQMGEFAIYSSIVAVLTVVAAGRYEIAILIPKFKTDALHLIFGCITIALGAFVFLTIVSVLFNGVLASYFKINSTTIYLIPIAVFLYTLSQIISQWLIRSDKIKQSATNKIIQTSTTGIVNIGAGNFNIVSGLIYGDILGRLFYVLYSCKLFCYYKLIKFKKIVTNLRVFSEYPKYNLFSALLDAISLNIPIFFLNYYFSKTDLGLFNHVRVYIGAPLSIVAYTVSQIFFQQIIKKIHLNTSIKKDAQQLFNILFLIGIVPVMAVLFINKESYSFIFGNLWLNIFGIMQILIFSFFVRFVVSPLSILLIALNKIKWLSAWQVLYFMSLFLLFFFVNSLMLFLKSYVVIEITLYFLYLCLIRKSINNYETNIIKQN